MPQSPKSRKHLRRWPSSITPTRIQTTLKAPRRNSPKLRTPTRRSQTRIRGVFTISEAKRASNSMNSGMGSRGVADLTFKEAILTTCLAISSTRGVAEVKVADFISTSEVPEVAEVTTISNNNSQSLFQICLKTRMSMCLIWGQFSNFTVERKSGSCTFSTPKRRRARTLRTNILRLRRNCTEL